MKPRFEIKPEPDTIARLVVRPYLVPAHMFGWCPYRDHLFERVGTMHVECRVCGKREAGCWASDPIIYMDWLPWTP